MDRNTLAERQQWPSPRDNDAAARDVMTQGVRVAKRRSSLDSVAQIMKDADCGIVPVMDENHVLAGVVTDRDIVVRGLASGKPLDSLTADDVMSPHVQAVNDMATVEEITRIMGEHKIRRLPVVDDQQRLVGMISMSDLANRTDCRPELQTALEKISVPARDRARFE